MRPLETSRANGDADLEELAHTVSWAFGGGYKRALTWLSESGFEHVRLARRDGRVIAGLVEVPMGQWFGGQSVPTLGLAGVSVAPEARGHGVALGLVRAALVAARERGLVLSTLYPSTYGLYRKAGYELAGCHCRSTLELRALGRSRRSASIEPLEDGAEPEVEALYREVARRRNGYLDRGPYVWNRVRRPEREPARGFAAMRRGEIEGYVFLRPALAATMPMELVLSDFVARTPEAVHTLYAFLSDHVSTAARATYTGGPVDARLMALPERVSKTTIEEYWMLRIVDVRAALLGRGYPAIDASIAFEVEDDLLPDNSGTYSLRVEGGIPHVDNERGVPVVRLGVGALAALYSGFASPWELHHTGSLDADARALALLTLLFCGTPPSLPDFF